MAVSVAAVGPMWETDSNAERRRGNQGRPSRKRCARAPRSLAPSNDLPGTDAGDHTASPWSESLDTCRRCQSTWITTRRPGPTRGWSRRCCRTSTTIYGNAAERLAPVRVGRRRGGRAGPRAGRRADRRRAARDRLHVGGDRGEQPGDQGGRGGLRAKGQPPRHGGDRAQGRARPPQAAGARGVGLDGHRPRRRRPGLGRVRRRAR